MNVEVEALVSASDTVLGDRSPGGLIRAIGTSSKLLLLCLILGSTPALAEGWQPCADVTSPGLSYGTMALVPGMTWDSWRGLLQREWSADDRIRPGWSNTDAQLHAAEAVPLDTRYELNLSRRRGDDAYIPQARATPDQDAAYIDAGRLYHGGYPSQAVQVFDAIAAAPHAPYAAAAAYSAARATLAMGRFQDGIARLGQITADPALHEMWQAAHHLVGTLAYDTGASPLIAARLVDISHLLLAPHELRCRDPELRGLMDEAAEDLSYILRVAFPTDHRDDNPPWNAHTRQVLLQVAAFDPVVDLIQVLAAPSPFKSDGPWIEPFYPAVAAIPGVALVDQATVEAASEAGSRFTTHALEQAKASGNPLWAYALAARTVDPDDLPILQAAEATTQTSAAIPSEQRTLGAWLMAQEARILLMAGREDDALAIFDRFPSTDQGFGTPARFAAEGGIRFLLARRDLAGARRWAAAFKSLDASALQVPLARNWDEALNSGKTNLATELGPLASGLNLLPAARLIELSRKPNLPAPLRMAMVTAAWIRLYMLHQDEAFRALFPDIRSAYPALGADLDAVEQAWWPSTRRHRITRMLLRLPGLSPNLVWARDFALYYPLGSSSYPDVFAIDPLNPSDGNWWCPIDPQRMMRDAFALTFASPLSRSFWIELGNVATLAPTGELSPGTESVDAIARSWIAWHPLFKDAGLAELAQLAVVPSGPIRLGQEAIDWAQGSTWFGRWFGFDDGLPETLALAVRATRYGCRRVGDLGSVSHAAWQALHEFYPGSAAAKHTPYWFDEALFH